MKTQQTPKKQHAKNLKISFKRYMIIYTRGWIEANKLTIDLCGRSDQMQKSDLKRIKKDK